MFGQGLRLARRKAGVSMRTLADRVNPRVSARAGDVAAKAFERVPLMGSAARADPRLHHSGGRCRENPES